MVLAMGERLIHVFSRHLRGDPEVDADFAVRELMREPQDYRSAAFRTQLSQYHLEPSDPLLGVELPLQRGHRLGFELLTGASLVNISA